MKRILWLMVALAVQAGCGPTENGDTEGHQQSLPDSIRAELVKMGVADQQAREGFTAERAQDTLFLFSMMRGDSARTRRLRQIVDQYGWPTERTAGAEAADAAFLILQHSPEDDYQASMLPVLEQLAREDAIPPSEVAMLVDRVLVQEGKPQRYGTQFSVEDGQLVMDPIEDEAGLEERRREMELPPMEEYRQLLEEHYGAPVSKEP